MPRTDVARSTDPGPSESGVNTRGGALDLSPLVRVVLPGALLVTTLAVVVSACARALSNSDTYFHLRFGSEFLDGWSLRDPGSVTSAATAHWVPTQWLPEIVMAQLEDWFGLAGVAWLGGVQVIGLVAVLWVAARRRAEPLLAAALVMTALLASSIGLSVRPQVISYVLVVVTVDAWLRTAEDARPRWWLVPLTWVWAMCHGMWPIGIALGGLALLGIALDRRTPPRRWLLLACVPALSALAAALTPVGPELYVQELRVSERAEFFSEWQSPYLLNHACVALLVLLAIVIAALLGRPWRGWVTVLMVLAAVGGAFWTWRTVPVAAAIAVPAGAAALQDLTRRVSAPPTRRELGAVTAACLLAVTALGLAVPRHVPDPTTSPGWLQPTLASLPSETKVLSTWDTSAILMWRFPDLDLIANGYGDAYTVPELRRSFDIQNVKPGWADDLRATGCRIAILPTGGELTEALRKREHWTVVHRSAGLEMLRAPANW